MVTTPAERLSLLAVNHGWTPCIVEADNATVLLLKRDGKVLIALWEQGKWRSGFAVWRGDAGVMGARRFGELVGTGGDLDAALDVIGEQTRATRQEREQATKEKAATRRAQRTAEAEAAARRSA